MASGGTIVVQPADKATLGVHVANVQISKNLTDPNCSRTAQALLSNWQTALRRLGSTGEFRIGHGDDGQCAHVHPAPFNGGFYIWTVPRSCKVFLSRKTAKPLDYAGAGRAPEGAYRGLGHCRCRSGH